MSKPGDIPQELYDRAWGLAGGCVERPYNQKPRHRTAMVIVRAILAAKAEEREACAVACDNQAAEYMDIAQRSLSQGSREEYVAKTQAASRAAFAIRKRGEG